MKHGQTGNLAQYGLESNKRFLVAISKADLDGFAIRFDTLDCSRSILSEQDEGMDLNTYLMLLNQEFSFFLQIGSPDSEFIRYCAVGRDINYVDRFLWIDCKCNESNYVIVAELFKKHFGVELQNILM